MSIGEKQQIDKAYILRIDTDISREYAQDAADSCDKVGMDWEYHEGFYNMDPNDAWNSIGLLRHIKRNNWVPAAQNCTAGHAAIWKKIYDNRECAIVMEHDALLLHNPSHVHIPHGRIVTLGYKIEDPTRYNHEAAGHPRVLRAISGHEGAHAYALTWQTAKEMLDEIEKYGVRSAVDNMYFLMQRKNFTNVPLMIMDPTPAIGWVRKSTIWGEANSSVKNYGFIHSFESNLSE
jgi:GR25 family glycosyltransferase involved in LPS biosynthesis